MSITGYLLFLGLSAAVAQAQNSNSTCCNTLQSVGLQHVYYPNNSTYQDRIASYWSISSQLHPSCFVQPTSTNDVVKIVNTLIKDPTCAATEFAVRAGGHMPWAASNNIDNGITIDLGLMNSTTLNKTGLIASIQPGARWGSVYKSLEPFGYTVAGGRAFDVGVGGFIMGGGNTFFANRFGFGVDNVRNYEIVLASGKLVNANLKENSDLFQVLKGGVGSNYGIVTRVDMQAIESRALWGGIIVHDRSTGEQHLDAHTDWVDNVGKYPPGSTVMAFTYSKNWGNITIVNFHHDTTAKVAAPAFKKFLAIPQVNNTFRIASHANMTQEIDIPYGYRQNLFVLTVRNDRRIYSKFVELHAQLIEEWKTESPDPDFNAELNMQAIPRTFTDHSLANGGNIMGLDRVHENVTMVLIIFAVKTAELEVKAVEKLKSYGKQMEDYATSLNGYIEWKHLNYAGGFQDPLASYGTANLAKMKAASAKYDPNGIFQTKSTPGFKVTKA